MPEATKVLYDVSQAVKELNKLNKKVDSSGKKAEKSFKKGSSSAKLFDKAIGRLPGSVQTVAKGLTGMSAGMAGLAVGAGVAVGAIASVVAQFIDFDAIMRDSLKSIEAFNSAVDTIKGTKEVLSNLGDQAINRDFELAARSVRLAQADNAREQNSVEQARDAAKARLDIVKDELARREDLLRASLDREESLRDRLNRRTAEDPASGFGGPSGKRALDLGAAARQAAFEGNLDLAEALESAAQKAAAEAGNHSLFLRDQEETRQAINSQIESQIAKEDQAQKGLQGSVDQAQKYVTELEGVIAKENARLVVLRQQTRELGSQAKIIQVGRREARDTQTADSAARTVEAESRKFVNNIENGGKSFKETVIDAGSELVKFLSDNADRQAAISITREAAAPAAEIDQLLKRAARGQATAADFDAADPALRQLTNVVANLKALEGVDSLSGDQTRTLRRLESLLNNARGAFGGVGEFRRVRGDEQAIQVGSDSPTRDQMDAIRNGILDLPERLGAVLQEKARSSNVPQQTAPAQSAGAPAPSAAAQNVTVNANVKGGIIDEDVANKIVSLIRKELRKGTTAGIA